MEDTSDHRRSASILGTSVGERNPDAREFDQIQLNKMRSAGMESRLNCDHFSLTFGNLPKEKVPRKS